jgi:hypothetical protein
MAKASSAVHERDSAKAIAKHKAAAAAAAAAAKKTAPVVPPKAAPKGAPEDAANKAGSSGVLQLRKSALSTEVGPRVINALYGFEQRVNELSAEMHELKGSKRYEQLSAITLAIVKAAKAEHKIDLSAAFSGDPKKIGLLNNQLGIALGFREVKSSEPDKAGVSYDVVVTSQAVKDAFPMPGETEKNCADFKRKNTFRANFLTQLKKCAQAAFAIIDEKIEAKYDDKAGTMQISGPAVRKAFGQERVVLDERKTIGTGDTKVELNDKPSFQALANIGAAAAGAATVQTPSGTPGSRGNKTGTVGGAAAQDAEAKAQTTGKLSLNKAVVSICRSLRETLDKCDKLADETIAALEELQNAIEVKLENA